MTETNVAYHVEDGAGRPAINVKDHNGGTAYTIALQRAVGPAVAERLRGRDDQGTGPYAIAYERIVSDFWQAAEEIATQRGLGEITQEGRSGGWLVFTSYDPQNPSGCDDCGGSETEAEVREWLAAYRSMVEWAETWIADAPRKVAALAQQYAMDEAGEAAARRMFAFGKGITA